MNIKKDKIYFIGYDAIGDYLSYNGLIRNLFNYYENVFVACSPIFHNNLNLLFNDLKNINFISQGEFNTIVNNGGDFDVIDTRVWEYFPKPEKHTGIYFNRQNKFQNHENLEVNDNSSFFYHHLGFDVKDKIKFFHYNRNLEMENDLFNKLNLDEKKYTAICEYSNCNINHDYINKENDIINLHNLSPNFLDIIKVIEESQEAHLVENSIALLVYYLQNNKLMKDVPIKLHCNSRKEPQRIAYKHFYDEVINNTVDLNQINLTDRVSTGLGNFYLNMLLYPKLDNWTFIW